MCSALSQYEKEVGDRGTIIYIYMPRTPKRELFLWLQTVIFKDFHFKDPQFDTH